VLRDAFRQLEPAQMGRGGVGCPFCGAGWVGKPAIVPLAAGRGGLIPVSRPTRDVNAGEQSGKHSKCSCFCIFLSGTGTTGWEYEFDITEYREQNISIANISITIGNR
jgi:hypothetical protein